MSRSRKKVAGFVDRNPEMKRKYNRSVRRKLNQNHNYEIADGNDYRKLNCSYDICDWKSLYFSKGEWDFWHDEDKGDAWYIPMYKAIMK